MGDCSRDAWPRGARDGEFIATVRCDRAETDEAEVAFLAEDAHQGRGVASALLEHRGR